MHIIKKEGVQQRAQHREARDRLTRKRKRSKGSSRSASKQANQLDKKRVLCLGISYHNHNKKRERARGSESSREHGTPEEKKNVQGLSTSSSSQIPDRSGRDGLL
jgi:hypothetical protein